jgi:CRP/FNR family cyclic AMP-dependent transcriptional regulator
MATISDLDQQTALVHFLQHCQTYDYPAKTVLIHAGEVNQNLYYVVEGSVAVSTKDEFGKDLVLAYLNKGSFIGEIGVFSDTGVRIVNVETRTACKIAQMSYDIFKNQFIKEMSNDAAGVLFMLGKQIAKRLTTTDRNIRDLAFMDTKSRVLQTLQALCKEPDALTHPQGMQIYVSRQEIARMIGCSREIIGRILVELEENHLISAHGKTIVVFGMR